MEQYLRSSIDTAHSVNDSLHASFIAQDGFLSWTPGSAQRVTQDVLQHFSAPVWYLKSYMPIGTSSNLSVHWNCLNEELLFM